MSKADVQNSKVVNRCAVCKVDLKGKFVYVDDDVEKLFEYPKEELFGKEIVDYLDKRSQAIFTSILNQRNHYETFFDSTTITIHKKDGTTTDLNVICSLNFNAGNPVNFQIIFDPSHSFAKTSPSVQEEMQESPSFINSEFDYEILFNYEKLVESLFEVSGASDAVLYVVDENKFEMVTATSSRGTDDAVLETLTQISKLHVDIVANKETYSFLDDESVRSALENYNEAPDELFLPICLNDEDLFYLRFLYPEKYNENSVHKSVKELNHSIQTFEQAIAFKDNILRSENSVVDIKFTIGFLDTIEVPAFLTDSEGEIVGYNPQAKKYFAESHLDGSYFNIVKSLVKKNSDLALDDIVDYINSPFSDIESDVKQFRVKVTSQAVFKMTIIKIGDNESDRSACFAFVPILDL